MTLGQQIRELRKVNQFSQGELAKLTGISQKHLCNIEKDKASPSIAALRRIAAAMDLRISVKFLPEVSE